MFSTSDDFIPNADNALFQLDSQQIADVFDAVPAKHK